MATEPLSNTFTPSWNRKIELPFAFPIDSEAIQVEVWNHRFGRPDVLIGSDTSNFLKKKLTNKPWGPKWVNLYSSSYKSGEVSLLGEVKDVGTYRG